MQLSSQHSLLSLLLHPQPSAFMSTKSAPSSAPLVTLFNHLQSIPPRSILTLLTTLLCLFIARIAYRYTCRRWRSRRPRPIPPTLVTPPPPSSHAGITPVHTPPTPPHPPFHTLKRCLRPAGAQLKLVVWDSLLYPLLAWAFNALAVVFALVVSFVPALLWVPRKKMKVCVATSLPSASSSSACTHLSRYSHVHHAEATELNKAKPAPSLSPYFSALMVPSALSCTQSRKSLVLDLDETLVHSQFKLTEHCDLRLEVRVDEFPAVFYVSKRPYLDVFLRTVAQWYDVVIFTASLQKYGDPLITVLDTDRVVKRRIFRQDCIKRNGNFVKDLTIVNPNLADVLIVDNSPAAYSIQPSNAVPIEAWYHDQNDEELLNLLPLLHAIAFLNDVRSLLDLRLTGGALAARRSRSVTR